MKSSTKSSVIALAILISIVSLGIGTNTAAGEDSNNPSIVKIGPTTRGDSLSPEQLREIKMMVMDSPPRPPKGIQRFSVTSMSQSALMLSVPTSTWTYGCSATSAGMIFGYYDRNGYSNMYTGPANGGVAPMTDLGQGIGTPIPGSCSIIATQNGFDGRTTKGHVDDYWTGYGNAGPDPWEGYWTEHAWGGCTADYMGTNQWKWDYDLNGTRETNTDGSTIFFYSSSNAKLYDYIPPSVYGLPATEGCHGMRLFAESRGYTVSENYTQQIDTQISGGFSLANYRTEINNGYPVMIQLVGHTMVGVGYESATSQTIYVNDTWDNSVHSMTWGGTYSGMQHWGVTVIHLNPVLPGQATAPSPSTGATGVDVNVILSWTAGSGATSHDVYFGTASTPPFIANQTGTTYDPPGALNVGTTYYWRIDEKNVSGTTTGTVWNFTTLATPGQATAPNPANGATNVSITQDINWTAGFNATSHDVYFGTTNPPTFCGNQTSTTYDTGTMNNGTTYYWRIDERNAFGSTTGSLWSFTTIARHSLTVSATTCGTVTTPGIGNFWYDHNYPASIVALEDANCHFINWTGTAVTAGKVSNPNSLSTTVLMDANYTVQANFVPLVNLTMATQPSAGGTTIPSAGNSYVEYGGAATPIEAHANAGYGFLSWTAVPAERSFWKCKCGINNGYPLG